MKAIFPKEREMGMETIFTKQAISTKETGVQTLKKVKEEFQWFLEMSMKENGSEE